MNRKGSMELGVNSIVILIIALAILGLGIGFVTRLFSQGEERLGGIIDSTDLKIHADSINPILFDKSEVRIKSGKSENLEISVYNDNLDSSGNEQIKPEIASDCIDSTGTTSTDISFAAPTQKISPGTDVGYLGIFRVVSGTPADTYICTIKAENPSTGDSVSQQIFVTVIT